MPRPKAPSGWTAADAEDWLLGLEQLGMRFGLDRMRVLMTALGNPTERFRAIHIVGTNGKSSTTRMTAAILQQHGLEVGSYLSPHLVSFTERIRIGDQDLDDESFATAVAQAAHAAQGMNRDAAEDDQVTQFEALTAAAFWVMADRGVDVAVVEAGLGGRYDATNVLHAEVDVLTNVGLEHTQWLGPTVRDIAREKVAVVDPGATLVVGAGLHPDAMDEARAASDRQHAPLVVAPSDARVQLLAQGGFQRGNFATARAAAEALLGELDGDRVRAAAASTLVPGRFQVVGEDPPLVLDGAHNPAGMEALAATLPAWLDGRRLVAVVSVLDDKDAGAMLGALIPLCGAVVCTGNANPRALPPDTLASVAGGLGATEAHVEPDPRAAVELARRLAGVDGVALATGSIYLIADLLRPEGRRGASI